MKKPCRPAAGRPRCARIDRDVLSAALRLLAAEGYDRMTVEAVAAAAGTTKPTVYRRWPTKADLATAALAHQQAAGLPEPTGALRDDLIAALQDFRAKLLRPNGMAMIGTLLVEERRTPELIALFRRRIVGPRRRMLTAVLEAAEARGELRPGADVEAAVNMLVGSLYARYLTGGAIPADWAARVTDAALAGLAAAGRAG